jgi:competence protein ComEA
MSRFSRFSRFAACGLLPPLSVSLATLFIAPAPAMANAVNINTADAATIAGDLKGIGLKRAQAIVEYRTKHGPFRSADELSQIKGIGAKVIQKNRADIRTDGSRPAAPSPSPGKPAAAPVKR